VRGEPRSSPGLSPTFGDSGRDRSSAGRTFDCRANSWSGSTGLATYPSMPALKQVSRSPLIACSVMAMMGMCDAVPCSRPRIRLSASHPSMIGICTSISTRSNAASSIAANAALPSGVRIVANYSGQLAGVSYGARERARMYHRVKEIARYSVYTTRLNR
jgi:hypothetical protein